MPGMSLSKRDDYIDQPQGAVWRMWEKQSQSQWDFAVDNIKGTDRERKQWLKEQGGSSKEYSHMNSMVCFFKSEDIAVLYYLTWGK